MLAVTNHSVMTPIGSTAFASISSPAGMPAIASHRGSARVRSAVTLIVSANRAAANALTMDRRRERDVVSVGRLRAATAEIHGAIAQHWQELQKIK
jgi:hypothetical protein